MVEEFKYLVTVANGFDERSKEIDQCIQGGCRAYSVYSDICRGAIRSAVSTGLKNCVRQAKRKRS